ncbi:MAG: hypothetical protein US89_C0005G0051 [Candidatus Peregrinibacteria bacterium GW2011_GWF2_38_29]|nr:MAG: hypothetical protein US89_C0005G0051 [Candidatus Peregrinibacteria bacterium GW2011_GWF2_38_29]HBB02638.1 hypothetical protein [Candidatus Peregrinibacteria bacterium]
MQRKNFKSYAAELLAQDYNCGETVFRVLLKELGIKESKELLKASSFMNGGGRAGAQCGILDAGLMVLSLMYGRDTYKKSREPLQGLAYKLTKEFEKKYKSFLCRDIRPEGFSHIQPEDICNKRIIEGIEFLLDFFKKID